MILVTIPKKSMPSFKTNHSAQTTSKTLLQSKTKIIQATSQIIINQILEKLSFKIQNS